MYCNLEYKKFNNSKILQDLYNPYKNVLEIIRKKSNNKNKLIKQ